MIKNENNQKRTTSNNNKTHFQRRWSISSGKIPQETDPQDIDFKQRTTPHPMVSLATKPNQPLIAVARK